MNNGQSYVFFVNENHWITADTNNAQGGVTWDSTKWQFDVGVANCQIQLMPGQGLKSIDRIVVDTHEHPCPLTCNSIDNYIVISDPNAVADEHWSFKIIGTNNKGQPWQHDPKIYNDGSTGDPPDQGK